MGIGRASVSRLQTLEVFSQDIEALVSRVRPVGGPDLF